MRHRSSAIRAAGILIIALVFVSALLLAETKKFVPKGGKERQSMFLAYVKKRFVIDRNTKSNAFRKIAKIENATVVVDNSAGFPSAKMLSELTELGTPVIMVLPDDVSTRQIKRLDVLSHYDVIFRVNKETFTEHIVNRALALGPRRKIFELSPEDLGKEIKERLKNVSQFELRVVVPEGIVLSSKNIRFLKKLRGPKEIVIPADYPARQLSKLKGLKRTRILLNVRGVGPDKELVAALNQLGGMEGGACLRGLVKLNEIENYLVIRNLNVLVMTLENWAIKEDFIRMMNSRGGFE